MSSEQSLLLLCAGDQLKFGLHEMDPTVCLKGVICLCKDRWMSSRKVIVRGNLGLRLSALGLLLVHLILCQHMENLGLLGNNFCQGLWRWRWVIFRTMLGTFTIVPACVHHSAIQSAYMLLAVVNQSSCDWSCITNVENH